MKVVQMYQVSLKVIVEWGGGGVVENHLNTTCNSIAAVALQCRVCYRENPVVRACVHTRVYACSSTFNCPQQVLVLNQVYLSFAPSPRLHSSGGLYTLHVKCPFGRT